MEEQRRKLNLLVLWTFLTAVAIGVIYYVTGDPGESASLQGTLIAAIQGKECLYVPFF